MVSNLASIIVGGSGFGTIEQSVGARDGAAVDGGAVMEVGWDVGTFVGREVGCPLGTVVVGIEDGDDVGTKVGIDDGRDVGVEEGQIVGVLVGAFVGTLVGLLVGT